MTYEYACEACGHLWEAEQSIRDKPLKKCPECRKGQAKRLVSGGAGFLLKGGGWYADGYGSSGAAKSGAGKSDKSGSGTGGGDASASSDASTKTSSSTTSTTTPTTPKAKKSDESSAA